MAVLEGEKAGETSLRWYFRKDVDDVKDQLCGGDQGKVFHAGKVAGIKPQVRHSLCVFEEKQVGQSGCSRVSEGRVTGDEG